MCWFHTRKAVKDNEHIKHIGDAKINDKFVRDLLLEDIDALQIAPNESLFDAGSKLFIQKWKRHKIPYLKEFLEYFQKEWLIVRKIFFYLS